MFTCTKFVYKNHITGIRRYKCDIILYFIIEWIRYWFDNRTRSYATRHVVLFNRWGWLSFGSMIYKLWQKLIGEMLTSARTSVPRFGLKESKANKISSGFILLKLNFESSNGRDTDSKAGRGRLLNPRLLLNSATILQPFSPVNN